MNNLDIKINVKRLALYSKSSKSTISEDTMSKIVESFSKYLMKIYLQSIYEEIHSSRYKGHWEPVEEIGYKEYLGVSPEFDIFDLMVDAIELVKIGYNYLIRFKPSYKYPGSQIPLDKVLRAIDGGTSDFNARPIFRKCVDNINLHMYSLWEGFLAMRGVI